ncbi:MAG: EVE domain-containing protein [Gammaproteobacteria bacterium]
MAGYWLMKTEPDTFSVDDLVAAGTAGTCWEGVRNYQVRNMLRDNFAIGDWALIYHSSCTEPGIYGSMRVIRDGYPDYFAWDPESQYFDPRSNSDNPRWYMVDVTIDRKFRQPVLLTKLRETVPLKDMQVLRRGNRLSVTPVTRKQWDTIFVLANLHATGTKRTARN